VHVSSSSDDVHVSCLPIIWHFKTLNERVPDYNSNFMLHLYVGINKLLTLYIIHII